MSYFTTSYVSSYVSPYNLNIIDTQKICDDSNMVKIYSCENLFDLDSGMFLFDEEIEYKYNLHKSKNQINCSCYISTSNI
jgi:hypothetical protein